MQSSISIAPYMLISIIFFVIGIALSCFLRNKKKLEYKQYIIPFIICTTFALIPLYLLKHHIQHDNIQISGIWPAILDALHAMTGKTVHVGIVEISNEELGSIQEIFLFYTSILHIAALIAVVSFIVAMFKEFAKHLKYKLIENGKLCVFCNVSEQTLTLAQNIRNKDDANGIKHSIVFINTRKEELSSEFLEKIDKIGVYIFRTTLQDFVLKKCFLHQEINIFVFELDDIKNIHTMLSFIKKSDEKNSLHKVNYKLNTKQITSDINDSPTSPEKLSHGKNIINSTTGICIHILSSCHETETILDSIESNDLSYNIKYDQYDYFYDYVYEIKNKFIDLCGKKFSSMRKSCYNPEQAPKINHPHQQKQKWDIGTLIKIPINLRLVRENRSTFYNLFNTKPLFLGIRNDSLTVLVVGGGINGREAVKIASWCGQTLASKFEIILIDSDEVAKHHLERDCPEMFIVDGDGYSGNSNVELTNPQKFSKDECTVFFYKCHVEDPKLMEVLKKHKNIGYTICTLGDDHLNLRLAMKVRSFFENDMMESYKKRPFIAALLNDSFLVETGNKLKFDTKTNCWIHTFGGMKEIYAWDNIVAPYSTELGRLVNEFYFTYDIQTSCKDENFKKKKIEENIKTANKAYEQKEYNRTSSIATGIHTKYKIYAIVSQLMKKQYFGESWNGSLPENILKVAKESLELAIKEEVMLEPERRDEPMVEKLAKLEHRRWDTYMRSNGWKSVTIDKVRQYKSMIGDYRNFASRLQPCILPWDDLPKLSENLKKEFQEIDRALVRESVTMIEKAMSFIKLDSPKIPLLPTVGITGRRELALAESNQGEDPSPACKPLLIKLLRAIRALHYDIIIKNPQFFTVQPELHLCSCLASGKGSLHGADRFVAAEALKLSFMLDVALPFAPTSSIHTRDADDKDKSQVELNQLLYKARDVLIYGNNEAIERIASGDTDEAQKERDKIYQQASEAMLNHCNVLIVLWDGKHDDKIGGTCDTMRLALNAGKFIFYIDSQGVKKEILAKFEGHESGEFFKVEDIGEVWTNYANWYYKNKRNEKNA